MRSDCLSFHAFPPAFSPKEVIQFQTKLIFCSGSSYIRLSKSPFQAPFYDASSSAVQRTLSLPMTRFMLWARMGMPKWRHTEHAQYFSYTTCGICCVCAYMSHVVCRYVSDARGTLIMQIQHLSNLNFGYDLQRRRLLAVGRPKTTARRPKTPFGKCRAVRRA